MDKLSGINKLTKKHVKGQFFSASWSATSWIGMETSYALAFSNAFRSMTLAQSNPRQICTQEHSKFVRSMKLLLDITVVASTVSSKSNALLLKVDSICIVHNRMQYVDVHTSYNRSHLPIFVPFIRRYQRSEDTRHIFGADVTAVACSQRETNVFWRTKQLLNGTRTALVCTIYICIHCTSYTQIHISLLGARCDLWRNVNDQPGSSEQLQSDRSPVSAFDSNRWCSPIFAFESGLKPEHLHF